jgi:acetyl esterase/lipase
MRSWSRVEDGESFERLVREAVTQARYPLRGVVIDGLPPFLTTHAEYFPLLPLQVFRVHASRRLASAGTSGGVTARCRG